MYNKLEKIPHQNRNDCTQSCSLRIKEFQIYSSLNQTFTDALSFAGLQGISKT